MTILRQATLEPRSKADVGNIDDRYGIALFILLETRGDIAG